MSGVAVEVLAVGVAARRLVLAFILDVARETLALDLDVLLRHTSVSELRVCLLRMHGGGDGLGGLLAQVELAVRVEVVVNADGPPPVGLLVGLFVARPLAIGAFFFYDELLAAIRIDRVDLLKLARRLRAGLLYLRRVHLLHLLVLLVLFQAFL